MFRKSSLAGIVFALAVMAQPALAQAVDPAAPHILRAWLAGFGTSISLIMAIGAQNAFVLRQGILRQHVFWVCLFCAVSDALLITFGVMGAGSLMQALPWLEPVMRWGGAAFLLWYGYGAMRSAIAGTSALQAQGSAGSGLAPVIATVAMLTWANPHVYLDTVVLIGAISARWQATGAFAGGAITASFVFFFTLGYGARLLAPVFARPAAWRILDMVVAIIMWAIAAALISGV